MARLGKVTMSGNVLDIGSDWSMSVRATKPGPPERVDGMTVGFVTMTTDAPHGGEVHPDGDEFLYVISGRVSVSCDADAGPCDLGPGEGCIVPQGEWHRVAVVEPARLIHITPGPNGDHRAAVHPRAGGG